MQAAPGAFAATRTPWSIVTMFFAGDVIVGAGAAKAAGASAPTVSRAPSAGTRERLVEGICVEGTRLRVHRPPFLMLCVDGARLSFVAHDVGIRVEAGAYPRGMEQRSTPPFDDDIRRMASDLERYLTAPSDDDPERERQTRAAAARAVSRVRDKLNRSAAEVFFGPPEGRYWALIDMGDAFVDCDEDDAARRAYRAALLLQPGAPEPLYSLALLVGSAGDHDEAVNYALAALSGALNAPGEASQAIAADIIGFLVSCDAADQVAAALHDAGVAPEFAAAWLAHTV